MSTNNEWIAREICARILREALRREPSSEEVSRLRAMVASGLLKVSFER